MTESPKMTNKYVFRISRISERKPNFEESHGMAYRMYGDREKIEEHVWEGEFEIKDRAVVEILKGLLSVAHKMAEEEKS